MNTLKGTKHVDTLRGVTGDNTIYGLGGDDAIVGASAGKELLVGGSFESAQIADRSWGTVKTVGGWQTDGTIEIWGKDFLGVTATDGSKIMELDSDKAKLLSRVWQDVATEKGAHYDFSFDFAARGGTRLDTNTIEVYWNGTLAGSFDPAGTAWQKAQLKLVGTGGVDRIEFREQASDNDSLGGLIDNVSLKAVGDGNDTLIGGSGNDTLDGLDGDDIIYGGSKPVGRTPSEASGEGPKPGDDDRITAGDGNDTVYGNNGHDTIDGGNGHDHLFGGRDNDVIFGGTGNDRLFGDSGNDVLVDGSGNDVVAGGTGDDRIIAGSGDDQYAGGKGFDVVSFEAAGNGVKVDLSKLVATGMGKDALHGIEGVEGSAFDDALKGSKRDDVLSGGAGNDSLRGLGGADVLTGGEGSDTFVWRLTDLKTAYERGDVDRITDFSKDDQLDLREWTTGLSEDELLERLVIKDDGADAHLFVDLGGGHRELAVLENFAGASVKDMLAEGMLLT
jgi:Ca2+-binding RTX toxin-like protein